MSFLGRLDANVCMAIAVLLLKLLATDALATVKEDSTSNRNEEILGQKLGATRSWGWG